MKTTSLRHEDSTFWDLLLKPPGESKTKCVSDRFVHLLLFRPEGCLNINVGLYLSVSKPLTLRLVPEFAVEENKNTLIIYSVYNL